MVIKQFLQGIIVLICLIAYLIPTLADVKEQYAKPIYISKPDSQTRSGLFQICNAIQDHFCAIFPVTLLVQHFILKRFRRFNRY